MIMYKELNLTRHCKDTLFINSHFIELSLIAFITEITYKASSSEVELEPH